MRLLNIRNFTVFTVALGLCAVRQSRAHGGDSDYLVKTGPSPLRFSLAMANVGVFTLPSVLLDKPLPTNSTEIVDAKTNSVESKTTAIQNPKKPTVDNSFPPASPSDSQNNFPVSAPPVPAASDLLVVSPQMLTEFFKPGPGGSNSTIVPVVLPTPVGFTPPSEKPSSQATYKTE